MFRIPLRKRYIIVILAFLGNILLYQLQLNTLRIGQNETIVEVAYYTGWACSCFAGILCNRYGGAVTFGFAIAIGAVCNLLAPLTLAWRWGRWWLALIRFQDGFVEMIANCALSDTWSRWSPPAERSRMVIISYSGFYFGALIRQILSQFDLGTKTYLYESVSVIWSIIWLIYVRNDPAYDNYLSYTEKQYLIEKIQMADRGRYHLRTYPWKSILTLKQLWILSIVAFAFQIGLTFSAFLPTPTVKGEYIIEETAFPYVIQLSTLMMACLNFAYAADYASKRGRHTSTKIRKFYICTGFIVGAVSLIVKLAGKLGNATFHLLFPHSTALVEMALLVNVIDLSPRYSSVLYGIQKTFRVLGYLIINAIDEKTTIQIITIALVYLLAALAYYVWGSAEVQPWNTTENEEYELETPNNDDDTESRSESQYESEPEASTSHGQ